MNRLALLLALAALLVAARAAADGVRRFAIVAGNNEGGEGTRPLRYAERDAERIHDALVRLGGVAPPDAWLLVGGSAADLSGALATAEREIVRDGGRAELFVYFSGHARDGQLRLGRTAFPLATLKDRLAASGAAIRIAFLDACRSGQITRTKGARRAPAFDVDAGPRPATGLVILTSSSNDEDSQESDAITGSFFTSALVSGMLGDADASGDGRVSLAEAYAYAYGRTVEGTLETRAGPQHPTFSFDLAGQGDVILTRLEGAGAALVLPASLEGTFVVVEAGRRTVAAEVKKPAGVERRVAVAPGPYLVKTRREDHLLVAAVSVPRRGEARLDEAALRAVPFSDDPVKGVAVRYDPRRRWVVGPALLVQTFLSAPTGTCCSRRWRCSGWRSSCATTSARAGCWAATSPWGRPRAPSPSRAAPSTTSSPRASPG
jgi:hypothetical protein